jgi:hypothetical protein
MYGSEPIGIPFAKHPDWKDTAKTVKSILNVIEVLEREAIEAAYRESQKTTDVAVYQAAQSDIFLNSAIRRRQLVDEVVLLLNDVPRSLYHVYVYSLPTVRFDKVGKRAWYAERNRLSVIAATTK